MYLFLSLNTWLYSENITENNTQQETDLCSSFFFLRKKGFCFISVDVNEIEDFTDSSAKNFERRSFSKDSKISFLDKNRAVCRK